MNKLKHYGNFIKVEHSIFSFPLIFAGSFMAANGIPDVRILVLIILAGIGARTSALAINRIIDHKIDASNPRTKNRELPSGKINIFEAIVITALGLLVYLISAYLICNIVLMLSPIPIIVFIIYPLMKRFTPFCHFGVGMGLALAPLGGWIAVSCSLENLILPLILALFTFLWVSGFDIIYATLDEQFDKLSGIYSIIAVYGKKMGLQISAILHILAFFCLVLIYLLEFKTIISLLILLISGILLYLEHEKSENVDLAFFKINIAVGFAVFLFVLSGIYLP